MRKTIQSFIASIISLLVSSSCVLFVPKVYNHQAAGIICSIVFWCFMVVGYILQYIRKKKIVKTCSNNGQKRFFKFFCMQASRIVDLILIVFIIWFILLLIIQKSEKYMQYVCLFGLVFSLHMHFLFNGEVYQYIESEVRREK